MNDIEVRTVSIGGREYDKPFDPGCACCRSPWLIQIDDMLSQGYSTAAIRQLLKGRRPACPHPEIIRDHTEHLAAPHLQMRMQLESRKNGTEDLSLVKVPDAAQAMIQAGYARLASGEIEVTAKDLLKAMSLQLQIDKAAQQNSIDASVWQAALMELVELVQGYLSPPQWRSFVEDAYASPRMRTIITGQQPVLAGKESEG
jgi:hypothetical protein